MCHAVVIRDPLQMDVLTKDFKIGNTVSNAILFADDQTSFSESEYDLQGAVNRL
jgi:hypothetical protein